MKIVVAGGSGALGLTGRRAVPARLTEAGFTFRYPHLAGALDDLLGHELKLDALHAAALSRASLSICQCGHGGGSAS